MVLEVTGSVLSITGRVLEATGGFQGLPGGINGYRRGLRCEEMHLKWCPFPHFVGLATNMSFTLVTKFLFEKVWARRRYPIFIVF